MAGAVLPDPWFPEEPHLALRKLLAPSGLSQGTLVSVANHAHYWPITMPCDAVLYAIRFAGANALGDYDLGLYGPDLGRIASKGATALAATVQELSLADIRVRAGETYFAAISFSLATAQVTREIYSAGGFGEMVGWGHEASAHPLPATATPVTTTSYATFPVFAFGVR